MPSGAVLSKSTTYKEVEDRIKLSTNSVDNQLITSSLISSVVNKALVKVAKLLDVKIHPFYLTSAITEGTSDTTINTWDEYEDLWDETDMVIDVSITGSANPFTIDLSSLTPFITKIEKVVHINSTNTRTLVKRLDDEVAENFKALSEFHGGSLFYVWEGDSIKFFKGSSFTLDTTNDRILILFRRLPITSSVLTHYLDIPDAYVSEVIEEAEKEIGLIKENLKNIN